MDIPKDNIAGLSRNDILSIIKACSKNNVESLKVHGLEIEFSKSQTDQSENWPVIPASKLKEYNAELPSDPRLDQELDQLMISDPEAYEQAVLDGALDGETVKDFRS